MATQSIKVADIFASFGFKINKGQMASVNTAIHSGGQKMEHMSKAVKRTDSSFKGLMGTMRQVEGLMLGIATFQVGKFLVNSTREFESMENAMRAASGTQEDFQKNNGFLQNSVDSLGLSLKETTGDYVNMLASGKDLIGVGGVNEIFGAVTEYATVLGLNADKTHGTLLALTQIMSKGKVQSEELRGQLGERLPNAYGIAAKAMGLTTAELNKQLELGNIASDVFLPKFAKELRKTFTSADLDRGMKSLNANMNRLNTEFFRMGATIGKGGSNAGFSGLFKDMASVMQNSSGLFEVFGGILYALMTPIRVVIRLFDAVVDIVGRVGEAVGANEAILKGTLVTLGVLATGFIAPWVAVIATLTTIGLILEDLWVGLNGGESAFKSFGEWIYSYIRTPVQNTITTIMKMINAVKNFSISDLLPSFDDILGSVGIDVNPTSSDFASKSKEAGAVGGSNISTEIGEVNVTVGADANAQEIKAAVVSGIEDAAQNKSRIQYRQLEG